MGTENFNKIPCEWSHTSLKLELAYASTTKRQAESNQSLFKKIQCSIKFRKNYYY